MPELGENTVLLFYREHESDTLVPGDRHLKRLIRPLYHRLTRRQKVSGFLVWYQLLVKALRAQGLDVRHNDFRLARRNPRHPVGLIGYPEILRGWSLPNPAVLGPGLVDHPKLAPELMRDPRFRSYVVTCGWMRELFAPYYGAERVVSWYAGIDLAEWPDTRGQAKDVDVLVYDKIRWNRDRMVPELLDPLLRALAARGLRVESVRYKEYDHAVYRELLGRSRAMVFLCEHETQGMAYQEALASNVPILAWDNGFWLDPHRAEWEDLPVPASSVPYFSAECGERFRGAGELEEALERFWGRLDGYTPRAFVARELSQKGSAELYMRHYRAAAV
jgi:hypothetical protein